MSTGILWCQDRQRSKGKRAVAIHSPETQTPATEKQNASSNNKRSSKRIYHFAKRVLDILLATLGLIVTLIPMAVIAIFIKAESPGPVIYVHKRIGKNGKPLALLKFRSMCKDANQMIAKFTPEEKAEWEANFKLEKDPRVTKVGNFLRKSSLDELPQLLNVLKGELSLVGPRPVVAEELEKYGDQKEKFLSILPGLTGYWQAYARSSCTYEKRMEMELYYVDHASFWWDIKILFATVGAVLKKNGAK